HPSMPLALPPTAVDHVCNLEEIGGLLHDILAGTTLPERIQHAPDHVLDEVLKQVTRHANIDFTQYKHSTIMRRIGRRMAVNRMRSLDEYRNFIEAHPQETGELIRSLLIKVTEFFRDPEAFALLEKDVMPTLIERGRERGRV